MKGIVHTKNENLQKMYSPSGRPRCRWVCFFIITNLEKCSITSLAHQSAVNGCRQNESPNIWYKHHNNSQVIHTTPVHKLMSCQVKICMFVRNESIVKKFLTSNCCFRLKYESIIHNNAFSSKKVVSSEWGEKYAQIKHRLQVKIVQNS